MTQRYECSNEIALSNECKRRNVSRNDWKRKEKRKPRISFMQRKLFELAASLLNSNSSEYLLSFQAILQQSSFKASLQSLHSQDCFSLLYVSTIRHWSSLLLWDHLLPHHLRFFDDDSRKFHPLFFSFK